MELDALDFPAILLAEDFSVLHLNPPARQTAPALEHQPLAVRELLGAQPGLTALLRAGQPVSLILQFMQGVLGLTGGICGLPQHRAQRFITLRRPGQRLRHKGGRLAAHELRRRGRGRQRGRNAGHYGGRFGGLHGHLRQTERHGQDLCLL